ncbi:hypothetical protein [Streptomyces olivochromogenes]|uniref:Uncharacterized protein n=1 Tax=Streptomyces olivochromogenes TaxID=1963 RepID=A0A250VG85_STROL|nr:hypothetical protein [Streptomyces olivochromogenes]GAX53185.1 hypothetical protein SO3561_04712 [Streptomyces olivochromogenes]
MAVLMVRATVRPECVDDLEAALRKMFAAIEVERPEGGASAKGGQDSVRADRTR